MKTDHPTQPNFLIIGAQKCGTTWLHHQLSRHPGIFLPAQKELEFFSYEAHLADPGLDRYREHFAGANDRVSGEATASYFWTWSDSPWCKMPDGFQKDIPGVVRSLLGPDLRLIVSLRNPVDRAVSAWGHYLATGEVDPDLSFREACEYGGIVDMGFYARHLSRWREAYPAEQFLSLTLEKDIVANPGKTLSGISRFLDIEPISPDNEWLNRKIFPGPERKPASSNNGITIRLDALDRQVNVSANDLEWLAKLYQSDQAALSRLLVEAPV